MRKGLATAADTAARTSCTYLSALYYLLAGRRGRKRAIMAVAHSILVADNHKIARNAVYKDMGADYVDRHNPEDLANRLVTRLRKLGYNVDATNAVPSVAA